MGQLDYQPSTSQMQSVRQLDELSINDETIAIGNYFGHGADSRLEKELCLATNQFQHIRHLEHQLYQAVDEIEPHEIRYQPPESTLVHQIH